MQCRLRLCYTGCGARPPGGRRLDEEEDGHIFANLIFIQTQIEMNIIEQIEYDKLKQFEDQIGGNVKVGGYEMDNICPINEGHCYQIKLQENDIDQLFLLGETTFKGLTHDKNYRLSGIIDSVKKLDRVKYWIDKKLDLRSSPEWSPVFVSPNTDGPIITIDGNHRLMAHYYQHKNIEGLQGYLFVHPNIQKWGFAPNDAR